MQKEPRSVVYARVLIVYISSAIPVYHILNNRLYKLKEFTNVMFEHVFWTRVLVC